MHQAFSSSMMRARPGAFSLVAPALLLAASAWASPSRPLVSVSSGATATQSDTDDSHRVEIARNSSSSSKSGSSRRSGSGSRGSRREEDFDPYGKDDPTGTKWGRAAGMGNRYGGLGNQVKERSSDDDRERREARDKRAAGAEDERGSRKSQE